MSERLKDKNDELVAAGAPPSGVRPFGYRGRTEPSSPTPTRPRSQRRSSPESPRVTGSWASSGA